MKKFKIKQKKSNQLQNVSQKSVKDKHLCFSFKFFDESQGQNFQNWHDENLLVELLEKLKSYSSLSIIEAQNNRFTIYGKFPTQTTFKEPANLKENVSWASMHIKGKECVIGHVVGEVFYIVFFDKNHEFYITKKKHT